MIKRTFGGVALMLVALSAASDVGMSADSTVKTLMHEKLESAHGVLEGLATEDFAEIEHHAELLREISRATTWYKADNPDFQHYAKSFQNSADYLRDQARAKNLEGVSMGYVRLTLDCVQCHTKVRAVQKGDKP